MKSNFPSSTVARTVFYIYGYPNPPITPAHRRQEVAFDYDAAITTGERLTAIGYDVEIADRNGNTVLLLTPQS